ncbi:MAG: aspartyl protease family protein [Phycisphaerae bacterium]|nr:aspartyl protease family protein [Phycisphaerae bacterium]
MTMQRTPSRPVPVRAAAITLLLLMGGCPLTIEVPVVLSVDFVTVPGTFTIPDGQVTVPLRLINGLAIVEATINGAGPFAVVIDTGSATTLVSPEVAAQFPASVFDTEGVVNAAENSTVQVTEVLAINSLTLGAAEASGFHANVVDLTGTEEAFRTTIDAIIGFSVFANVTLTIDYPLEQMRIDESTMSEVDAADVVPLIVEGSRAFINVTVGDCVLKTGIDTGYSGVLSVPENAELTFSTGPLAWFSSTDLTGTRIERRIGRLADDAWLGQCRWQTPVVVLDDKTSGNLGSGMLQLYALTFDQRSGLLRMERESTEVLRSVSQYTRGFDVTEIDGRVVVDELLPGGPAEYAGMHVGDIIVEVNGNEVSGLSTLSLPSRDEIAFVYVQRDGDVIDLAVPIWLWVE